jgi:hypothetical protein
VLIFNMLIYKVRSEVAAILLLPFTFVAALS